MCTNAFVVEEIFDHFKLSFPYSFREIATDRPLYSENHIFSFLFIKFGFWRSFPPSDSGNIQSTFCTYRLIGQGNKFDPCRRLFKVKLQEITQLVIKRASFNISALLSLIHHRHVAWSYVLHILMCCITPGSSTTSSRTGRDFPQEQKTPNTFSQQQTTVL